MASPVPEMDQVYKDAWKQPDHTAWDWTTAPGHVILPMKDFKALSRYDTTTPSGVYEGKMWVCDWRDGSDHLCWWDTHPTMANSCVVKHVPIMLLETVELLISIPITP